jgi:hypothetical protein
MNLIPALAKRPNIPDQMVAFVGKCPRLLPGESEEKYFELFALMEIEIDPEQATEWLVLADIVGLFWDIGRYRAWKGAILNVYRASAIQTALRETHRSHAVVGDIPLLYKMARTEAEEWRTDPTKRKVLDARLAEHGYDEEALNATALLEALAPLATIERFLSSARSQLNAMLKEICVRREFADRARKALREQLQAATSVTPPKQIDTRQ